MKVTAALVLVYLSLLHGHAASRPNVLFIAVDDLNNWITPLQPELPVHTPNLERLAKRSLTFTQAYCAAPACNPSRVATLTGVHPTTSGVYVNQQDWRDSTFFADKPDLPKFFKHHGYLSLGGGKIYHAHSLNETGYRGFFRAESWHDFYPSMERQLPQEVLRPQVPTHGNENFYGGRFDWAARDIPTNDMADTQVVEWAKDILANPPEQPLFLAVGIYRPHISWYTPKEFFDLYPELGKLIPAVPHNDLLDIPAAGREMCRGHWHQWLVENDKWEGALRGYLASVSYTDFLIGELLTALERSPISENTILVLWSDHGYHLGHKMHWEKFALWEQTTQVPLFISSPQHTGSHGKQCYEPVSLIDLFPTLTQLCDLPLPGYLEDEGHSLVPLLEDPTRSTNRHILTTQGRGNHAVRSSRWRYIRYSDGSEELYDHQNDPHEFTNLASQEGIADTLKALSTFLPAAEAAVSPEPRKRKGKP